MPGARPCAAGGGGGGGGTRRDAFGFASTGRHRSAAPGQHPQRPAEAGPQRLSPQPSAFSLVCCPSSAFAPAAVRTPYPDQLHRAGLDLRRHRAPQQVHRHDQAALPAALDEKPCIPISGPSTTRTRVPSFMYRPGSTWTLSSSSRRTASACSSGTGVGPASLPTAQTTPRTSRPARGLFRQAREEIAREHGLHHPLLAVLPLAQDPAQGQEAFHPPAAQFPVHDFLVPGPGVESVHLAAIHSKPVFAGIVFLRHRKWSSMSTLSCRSEAASPWTPSLSLTGVSARKCARSNEIAVATRRREQAHASLPAWTGNRPS